jgi:predicted nucleic acid-binding Zn ribbon protein
MKRLISSGGGLIFKGSGFYATDYKNGRGGPSAGKSKDKKSSESRPSSDAAPCAGCAESKSCPNKQD